MAKKKKKMAKKNAPKETPSRPQFSPFSKPAEQPVSDDHFSRLLHQIEMNSTDDIGREILSLRNEIDDEYEQELVESVEYILGTNLQKFDRAGIIRMALKSSEEYQSEYEDEIDWEDPTSFTYPDYTDLSNEQIALIICSCVYLHKVYGVFSMGFDDAAIEEIATSLEYLQTQEISDDLWEYMENVYNIIVDDDDDDSW